MADTETIDNDNGYQKSDKNRYVAAILAYLLGGIGAHKFYIGQKSKGKKYLLFFWTAIPLCLGIIHAIHYLIMGEEEFHRRLTMEEEEFEEWKQEKKKEAKQEAERIQKEIQEKNEPSLEKLPDDYLEQAEGSLATEENIKKVVDILDEGEVVYYITEGSTIDVEGSSAGSSLYGDDRSRKVGTKGRVRMAVTEKRIAVKVPQYLGDDERSVPYHSITSVDLDTGLQNKRFSLQTPGQTYHIGALNPDKEECREIASFIRDKISEEKVQETVVTQEADPTEQLQNLKELHEQGTITDEEFEEKRETLLNKIE